MKNIIISLLCVGLMAACGSGAKKNLAPTGSGEKISGPIKIPSNTPYGAGAVADNVKNDCTDLGTKLSDFTASFGKEKGIEIKKVDSLTKDSEGNTLVMEITNVHSGGNAFLGHKKSVTLKAALYKGGTLIDSVERSRTSGGGIGGGFKSSCAVLGRTVKTLGADVAVWLKNYSM